VRSHWGIENKLHWVLDVVTNEDRNRGRGYAGIPWLKNVGTANFQDTFITGATLVGGSGYVNGTYLGVPFGGGRVLAAKVARPYRAAPSRAFRLSSLAPAIRSATF
jgi:hypothetical protein